MTVGEIRKGSRRADETTRFVERALRDFGYLEAFQDRSQTEREACLQWIAASRSERSEEYRVSELLDALAGGVALPAAQLA